MQPSATDGIIEICKIVDGHNGNLNIKQKGVGIIQDFQFKKEGHLKNLI